MEVAVDWASWPMLEMRADGGDPSTPAAVAQALQEAIGRAEPFAAVVVMAGVPARRRVAGAVERVRMVRRLRPGLVAHCRGLAFVMPVAAQRDNAKSIKSADKIWGCPTLTTDDPDRARGWAHDRLHRSV